MDIVAQLILNSVIAGAIYSLVALGFNLIYGTTKFFNLAHGVLAAVGAYAVFFFAKSFGWNIFVSIGIGIVLAGFIGYGLNKLVYEPLRKRKASNMVLLVASLGVLTALQAMIAILFTSQFQVLSSHIGTQHMYSIFGGIITQTQLIILFSGFFIMAGLVLLLDKTNVGKAIKAISDDEEVAKMVGINTNQIIGYVFFIGSAIAGLAGILIGFDIGIEPTMGLSLLLKGVLLLSLVELGISMGECLGRFFWDLLKILAFGKFQVHGKMQLLLVF